MTDWVVPWAMYTWLALFVALVGFELFALWWNKARGDGKQRANLTAYVTGYFRTHKHRQLKRRGPVAALVAVFIWGCGHFLGYW